MSTINQIDDSNKKQMFSNELIDSVSAGNISSVRRLLAGGIHPDTPDSQGRIALREAAVGNHYHIAFELLNRGAAVDAVNCAGRTSLMTACSFGSGEMVSLLLFYGADADLADAEGMTALMIAADTGNYRVVGILLDFLPQININAVDVQRRSALDIALAKRDLKVSRILTAAGALKTGDKPFERQSNIEYGHSSVVAGIGGVV